MKKIMIMASVAFISMNTYAQKVNTSAIPTAVTQSFSKLYPEVKDVDWEKENGNYEAEFEKGKTETSVLFDASGKVLETEVEINPADLPQPAKDYCTQYFSGAGISEASKISAADGSITYEAEVRDQDLIFDAEGHFIKKVVGSKDEEDED